MRRQYRFLIVGLVLVAALFIGGKVFGQGLQCNSRENMVNVLQEKYGERVRFEGQRLLPMTGGETLEIAVELWDNPATGTWTVTGYSDGGAMCMLGSGGNSEFSPRDAVERSQIVRLPVGRDCVARRVAYAALDALGAALFWRGLDGAASMIEAFRAPDGAWRMLVYTAAQPGMACDAGFGTDGAMQRGLLIPSGAAL